MINYRVNFLFAVPIWIVLSLFYIVTIKRYLEREADIIAARKVGKDVFKKSLQKLSKIGMPNDCLFHGTFSFRIKRIEKINLSKISR